MNLALLDPFRRQIPDRIDSTLTLPSALHPQRPKLISVSDTQTRNRNVNSDSNVELMLSNNEAKVSGGDETGSAQQRQRQRQPQHMEETMTEIENENEEEHSSSPLVAPAESITATTTQLEPVVSSPVDPSPHAVVESHSSKTDIILDENPKSFALVSLLRSNPTSSKGEAGASNHDVALESDENWHSCYIVSFNRRGTYLSAGHASGAIPVHDFTSRTLSCIYRPLPHPLEERDATGSTATASKRRNKRKSSAGFSPPDAPLSSKKLSNSSSPSDAVATTANESSVEPASPKLNESVLQPERQQQQYAYCFGVTSLTWSRRSRTLLAAAIGDPNLRLMDNTHPFGSEDVCCDATIISLSSTFTDTAPSNSNSATLGKENATGGSGTLLSSGTSVERESPLSLLTSGGDADDEEGTIASTETDSVTAAAAASAAATKSGSSKKIRKKNGKKKEHLDSIGNASSGKGGDGNESILARTRLISDVIVWEPPRRGGNVDAGLDVSSNVSRKSERNLTPYPEIEGDLEKGDSAMSTPATNAQFRLHGIDSPVSSVLNKTDNTVADGSSALPPTHSFRESLTSNFATATLSPCHFSKKDASDETLTKDNNKAPEERSMEERHLAALKRMQMLAEEKEKKKSAAAQLAADLIEKGKKKKSKKASLVKLPPPLTGPPSAAAIKGPPTTDNTLPVPLLPPLKRYQTLILPLPTPVGGSVQIHPRDAFAGLACLNDGSLIFFSFPRSAFFESVVTVLSTVPPSQTRLSTSTFMSSRIDSVRENEQIKTGKLFYLVPPPHLVDDQGGKDSSKKINRGQDWKTNCFVTCAAFSRRGRSVYAATKCGTLLGFRIPRVVMEEFFSQGLSVTVPTRSPACPSDIDSGSVPLTAYTPVADNVFLSINPSFRIKIPGSAVAWHIVVSRNDCMILVNSADSALRLYNTEECWNIEKEHHNSSCVQAVTGGDVREMFPPFSSSVKPRFVFRNLVSKVPWASCDFSGDGEHVVGGCNSTLQSGDNYELFLWNTATGALLDQLTGPQVLLYSVSWHPTRSFIAVGTSDGLVDVWGPRMDWTAFAPDFQALPVNVEYIEREDEFDIVIDGDEEELRKREQIIDKMEENEIVDVATVERVPVFDSDSESETDLFYFETKVRPLMSGGKRKIVDGGGSVGKGYNSVAL